MPQVILVLITEAFALKAFQWGSQFYFIFKKKRLTTYAYLGIKGKRDKKKKGGGNSKRAEGLKNDNGATAGEGTGMDETQAGDLEPRKASSLERGGDDDETPVQTQKIENGVSIPNGLSSISHSLPLQGVKELASEESSPKDQTDHSGRQDVKHTHEASTSNGSRSEVETNARLDTLASERAALQAEVAQLRKSLEEVQERHEEELTSMQEQLAASQDEKVHAETQYHNLLGKVNTIKSQLGERLKADAVCLRSGSSKDVLIL